MDKRATRPGLSKKRPSIDYQNKFIFVMHSCHIDVRTQPEFDAGHIPDALHHDLELLERGVFPDIPKDTQIQVYCRSGNRSALAKMILEQAGFTNVTNIGGFPR